MAAPDLGEVPPFHDGELGLQERMGVRDKVARFGLRGIRPFMPDEHREFFEQLPFVFVSSLDVSGQPWGSMVWGLPGFIESPDATTLHIAGTLAPGDPLSRNIVVGGPAGLLGLELETRRRNRANGIVVARQGDAFTLRVTQSFGNCQKYIQVRKTSFRRDPFEKIDSAVTMEPPNLSPEARALVSAADTFFIASRSAHPASDERGQGTDISHRGGLPGFVRVDDGHDGAILTFPDYVGNFLFNTLGNVAVDPRVGLLFVDFARGSLVSLSGTARIVWDGPEVRAVEGAERLVRVAVDGGVRTDDVLPFEWTDPLFAPQFGRR